VRLFITGTDTEVGKSVVTACLAAAAEGSVVAAKPVASGVAPGTAGEDALLLAAAAGHPPCTFVTLEAPVSPHRAARLEGREIDRAGLLQWIRDLQADTVLVEGVGGWMVPILLEEASVWVSDLAAATRGKVLVVADDTLGVLNRTLLTVRAIRADGFEVAAVVLNQRRPADPSRASNASDLRELLDIGVGVLPALDISSQSARREHGRMLWSVLRSRESR